MTSSLKLRTLKSQQEQEAGSVASRLPTTLELWVISLTSLWFVAGLFLDGWAHNHRPDLESFFTPWHAVFYSGYLVTAIALLATVFLSKRKHGGTFFQNIPQGFGHALIGAGLFAIGGVGDMAWHQVFGIEADIEALLSPTHLLLAISMMLMVSTGLRVWFRTTPPIGVPSFFEQLPMLLSATYSLLLIWFMTQFSHFVEPRAAGMSSPAGGIASMSQNIAISGYLLHTAILLGITLFILRRARIATGGLTFIFTISMLGMALMRDGIILVASVALAGILADVLSHTMHPLELHRRDVRVFSTLVPMTLFTAYFLTLRLTDGLWWSVHMWAGAIVMAGLSGLLVSFLVLPMREWNEK